MKTLAFAALAMTSIAAPAWAQDQTGISPSSLP